MLQSFIEKKSKMHAMNTKPNMLNMRGFTLVELMIALFLTAIATVAIYRGYVSFSRSADIQEQTIEMQQNLRIGMWMLEKDLRRAGMNEEDDENAGFSLATPNTVMFTMDLGGSNPTVALELTDLGSYDEGDGDVADRGEQISYTRRGPNAQGVFGLYRNDENLNPSGTGNEIISNLDALNFVYLIESGSALTPVQLANPSNWTSIRSVQVSMVVHTTNEDYSYNDNTPYQNLQGDTIFDAATIPATDDAKHRRRRVLSKQVKIRNAGL